VTKIPTDLLSLAGEYRVCSELNKRGVFATVTYGNRKSVDLYAINGRQQRALKIAVKTNQTQKGDFVTGITQKGLADDPDAPDFCVLFHIRPDQDGKFTERFFVLTHEEICQAQAAVNRGYAKKYLKRHGKQPDLSKGVDNVTVADVEPHEDQWFKIVDRFSNSSSRSA
jgi:hypothetical protein